MQIFKDERGYYEMYIDGKFINNYSTIEEAVSEYEKIESEKE